MRMPPSQQGDLRFSFDLRQCVCTTCVLVMEEWGYVEDEELQNWKGNRICSITCTHFSYGVDPQCRSILRCKLKRKQLQQGEHLLKLCEHWLSVVDQPIAG